MKLKKTLQVLIGILFIVPYAYGTVNYSEDFDSYNPGERPVGWSFNNTLTGYVADTQSVSPPNSLFADTSGVNATYTSPVSLVAGTYSFSIYFDDPSYGRLQFLMAGNAGYAKNIYIGTAYVKDNDYAIISYDDALSLNKWHNIDISFNYLVGTYSLIVDGKTIWTLPLAGAGSYITSYVFATGSNGSKYFDNIKLTDEPPEEPPLDADPNFEDFDSYYPGQRPDNWTFTNTNTGYVADTRSLSSPNSLVTDESGVSSYFNPGENPVAGTYAWSVYIEDVSYGKMWFLLGSDDGYAINLELGTSYLRDNGPDYVVNSADKLSLNTWHNIQIVFDHGTGTYDLIIDDEPIWTHSLDGPSNYSTSYVFANNSYGIKYYDNVSLTLPEKDSITIMPLWIDNFDDGYYLGDWMDHVAEYAAKGWTIPAGASIGEMDIIDSATDLSPRYFGNIEPPSAQNCLRFIKDAGTERFIKHDLPIDDGDTFITKGFISWSFYIAYDIVQPCVFILEGYDTSLIEFSFGYAAYGKGQVTDITQDETYTGSLFTMGRWHEAEVEFDCVERTYSLAIDDEIICTDRRMRGDNVMASAVRWGASSGNESFLDNLLIGTVDPMEIIDIAVVSGNVELKFQPMPITDRIKCIMWADDPADTWRIARKFRTDENVIGSWTDSGDTDRPAPGSPSTFKRFYKIGTVDPAPVNEFIGNYVVSMKFLDQSETVNPAGDVGEHYVRLCMFTFNPDSTITNNYWEWSLYDATDSIPYPNDYNNNPEAYTTRLVGNGVGGYHPGPLFNQDQDKHIGGLPRHLGSASNLTLDTGTWSLTGRRITIVWNDGRWEKWYIIWEEPGNLYKIEQYDASYIKEGTRYSLTKDAVNYADPDRRDLEAVNVGWGFGCSSYDFTYARPSGSEFKVDLIGASLLYNIGLTPHERPVAYGAGAGFSDFHLTDTDVLRTCVEGTTYWSYGYFTAPLNNPGILARRALYHLAGDGQNLGHIEYMWGHRNAMLQIIDNAGAYRGVVVVQYYTDLSVAARYWLVVTGANQVPSCLGILPEN